MWLRSSPAVAVLPRALFRCMPVRCAPIRQQQRSIHTARSALFAKRQTPAAVDPALEQEMDLNDEANYEQPPDVQVQRAESAAAASPSAASAASLSAILDESAAAIAAADVILITAGAGMGVDSGLPDFRTDAANSASGQDGFWRSYPPAKKLGVSFVELADPSWFHKSPAVAWGFYGMRYNTYRRTQPHAGFDVLYRWAALKQKRLNQRLAGANAAALSSFFVLTSNVDGQFQTAWNRLHSASASNTAAPPPPPTPALPIHEVHGSIHHMQCLRACAQSGTLTKDGSGIWRVPVEAGEINVDPNTYTVKEEDQPRCIAADAGCDEIARPNVLMFGDPAWLSHRSDLQQNEIEDWLSSVYSMNLKVAVIECGAGLAVRTTRAWSERVAGEHPGATLIRINATEAEARVQDRSASSGLRAFGRLSQPLSGYGIHGRCVNALTELDKRIAKLTPTA